MCLLAPLSFMHELKQRLRKCKTEPQALSQRGREPGTRRSSPSATGSFRSSQCPTVTVPRANDSALAAGSVSIGDQGLQREFALLCFCRKQPLGILRKHIRFQVDFAACMQHMQIGHRIRVRQNCNRHFVAA